MQLLLSSLISAAALLHQGPDPLSDWYLDSEHVAASTLTARLGPTGSISGEVVFVADPQGESMMFDGRESLISFGDHAELERDTLPTGAFSVAAWVSVNTPQRWGGLIGVLQDDASDERGWILGYDDTNFTFGLSTVGADDGNGKLTYLKGEQPYVEGRLHFVVATYDGAEMRLYVDGVLDGSTDKQSGAILYPEHADYVIGAYKDDDEAYLHHGRIRRVSVYGVAAEPAWVETRYAAQTALASAEPYIWVDPDFSLLVAPYLQFVTQTGVTVMWETSRTGTSLVHYGETHELGLTQALDDTARLHEVRLEGLTLETPYFYRIESVDSQERTITSPVLTFQTAVATQTPFAFAVISDTQDTPEVAGAIAQMAWERRPNFALHPGDLVGTGRNRADWQGEFFPSMKPLIERVAFFPVLGNHEEDAPFFYDYMSLPAPEYYYDFAYGNAHFYMLDSNREVGPGSEQYVWLEQRLEQTKAVWKFVCYHHPSYSSDENDFGDMWQGKSTQGDLRVRELTGLYDRYGVDIVWNGHIHSYERTWPLFAGRAVDRGGTN
jgi:hypothetical protein